MPGFDDFFGSGFGGELGANRRVDLTRVLNQQSHQVVEAAAKHAVEQGHPEVDSLHLLWALSGQEPTSSLLRRVGVDVEELRNDVEAQLPARQGMTGPAAALPSLGPASQRVLLAAHQIARALGSTYVDPVHVLLALSANPANTAGRLLAARGANPQTLQVAAGETDHDASGEEQSETPTLDEYGLDLTAQARAGELDPVIGRAEEIEQTIEVLSRRTKNNPVLIGEAGVGKTAIVEGLAQRIVDGDVPPLLHGKRVVALEISGMLAGTRYRGDFEERMKKVIDEIVAHRDEVIVFIDEVHTVVGAGGADGAVDAGNILKPRLARGELHLVGATTLSEYRRIEKDPALERRFQPVKVDEPSVADAITILRGLQGRYEEHHEVRYTDEAVVAAVELSDRYLPDRHLPDKAIDLIDQAGARLRLRRSNSPVAELEQKLARLTQEKDRSVATEDYERASALRDEIAALEVTIAGASAEEPSHEVGADQIADVLARATGIPVNQVSAHDKERLRRLEDELHQRVIGQDDAVHAIARAVRRSRTGMGDGNRPVGSFLFLGPTGVGKTELAKALATSLFGDEDSMIRLDMSEFGERHNVSRLVGSPPGYVGYDEAGQLTEAVRRRPYSVVLLDEVEKAHPDVFNILLQVLDDGRLTDGQGRTVDFKNTVLIMTSNLGSDIISSRSGGIGFATEAQQREGTKVRERLMGRLRESFRPEFLNRIDEIVVFAKLELEQLRQITDLLLGATRSRLAGLDISLELTPAAVDWIAEHGHEPEFGARPLRRTIQREVDDRIADLLVDDAVTAGGAVRVDVVDGELTVEPVATAAVSSHALALAG
ncbi:ATP-dependent Clp protease ATP-binding subunit [Rhodococcus sp. X156]|uniref:ATP-dependent Clp protease ATP-binding subunit n=1 Tax=Rhodococcus sp. X156 TaxID=2499145 RepID=UPI000FDAFA39|nr:ATP-dependent Clp protease ATP-binding subunit [Rhodococcus sp. X156]